MVGIAGVALVWLVVLPASGSQEWYDGLARPYEGAYGPLGAAYGEEEQMRQQEVPGMAEEEKGPPWTLKTRSVGLAASGVVGLGLSKATTGIWRPRWLAWGALANGAAQAVGGRFGDLAQATSLTVLGASWRLQALSKAGEYPVFKQLKAATGLVPRRRFPPATDDPWRYRGDAPPFSMVRCVVGAICLAGFAVAILPQPPLVPTSLLAIAAAGFAVFAVALRDARGDAARCVVARSIAVASIFYTAANEAHLLRALAAALRLSGDRLSKLDRRFGLSRRLAAFAAAFAARLAGAAARPPAYAPPPQHDPLAGTYPPPPPGTYPYDARPSYQRPDVPPHYQQPPSPHQDQNHDWSF